MPEPAIAASNEPLCLDDRRPRTLRQLIGNEHVHLVLGQAMRNNTVPRLTLLYGATGSGKTTLAHILARYYHCKNKNRDVRGDDESCQCEMCQRSLNSIPEFVELTGEFVEREWSNSWVKVEKWHLFRPDFTIFLDETQDLSQPNQKGLLRDVEGAKARVIFATTHLHAINDALVSRFKPNIFELRRPTVEQVVGAMANLSETEDVTVNRDQLLRVATHYGANMRECMSFVYNAARQTQGKVITDNYINAVLGIIAGTSPMTPKTRKTQIKL